MLKFIKLPIIFSFGILMFSCGKIKPDSPMVNKEIPLENFDKIELKGKYRAFFVPSAKNFVAVESPSSYFDNLDIDSENQHLKITENREVSGAKNAFYSVFIYAKSVPKNISISDSVELNSSGTMAFSQLNIQLNEQAKFIGSLEGKSLQLSLKDKSSANLRGYAEQMKLNIQDSTGIIAPYFKIGEALVHAKKNSYTEIYPEKILDGEIGDGAKLLYYGEPIRKIKIDPKATVTHKKLD